MPPSDESQAAGPPSARQVGLSLLLLALFAPVVLAVGSAAFRPAWLLATLGGVPVSLLWVLGSILLFVTATWLFARLALAADDEGQGQ